MWAIVLLIASAGASFDGLEGEVSLKAATKTYMWRMRVAKDKKVSGFLKLDSPAISKLQVDLEIKKGEADLFVSVIISEQKYSWNSTKIGADTVVLSRSDSLFAKDGLGLQRRFEIGAYGVAEGNSTVCMFMSLTADYELAEGEWMLDIGSLDGVEVSEFNESLEEREWGWGLAAVVVVVGVGVWVWRKNGVTSGEEDLQIKLL